MGFADRAKAKADALKAGHGTVPVPPRIPEPVTDRLSPPATPQPIRFEPPVEPAGVFDVLSRAEKPDPTPRVEPPKVPTPARSTVPAPSPFPETAGSVTAIPQEPPMQVVSPLSDSRSRDTSVIPVIAPQQPRRQRGPEDTTVLGHAPATDTFALQRDTNVEIQTGLILVLIEATSRIAKLALARNRQDRHNYKTLKLEVSKPVSLNFAGRLVTIEFTGISAGDQSVAFVKATAVTIQKTNWPAKFKSASIAIGKSTTAILQSSWTYGLAAAAAMFPKVREFANNWTDILTVGNASDNKKLAVSVALSLVPALVVTGIVASAKSVIKFTVRKLSEPKKPKPVRAPELKVVKPVEPVTKTAAKPDRVTKAPRETFFKRAGVYWREIAGLGSIGALYYSIVGQFKPAMEQILTKFDVQQWQNEISASIAGALAIITLTSIWSRSKGKMEYQPKSVKRGGAAK